MNLSDKIMRLRKEYGWSQEELAYKIGVSRQAVSKWESGAASPEVDKIIILAKLFNISTDELILNENSNYKELEKISVLPENQLNQFLDFIKYKSKLYGIATGILISSSFVFILVLGLLEDKHISENLAYAIGFSMLFIGMITAIALFMFVSIKSEPFNYIGIEKLYIKDENKKELMRKDHDYHKVYNIKITIGSLLCILSILPLLVVVLLESKASNILYATAGTLILIAIGMVIAVEAIIMKDAFDRLLERGKYNKLIKKKKNVGFDIIYWVIVIIVYIGLSLITDSWNSTWIIWIPLSLIYISVKASLANKKT